MSQRPNADFLADIIEAIRRILLYTEGMTYNQFLQDIKTQDAVTRNLEIIGEATKNLSPEFRDRFTNVPWRSFAGVRDKLIHHYFGVNLSIVWNIATIELPDIIKTLETIQTDLRDSHLND